MVGTTVIGDPAARNPSLRVTPQIWYQRKGLDLHENGLFIPKNWRPLSATLKFYRENRYVGPYEQYLFRDIMAESLPLGDIGLEV